MVDRYQELLPVSVQSPVEQDAKYKEANEGGNVYK